ncbi:hypothetical protein CAPTEDRAFT_199705 [Capitella teleta]|uniref:Uncharacterized protein n=1 Tax=Capitella teleta TaxID=283909 RepID=R7TC19_CAPTE|nr:hypothetical protein CAPTEDRAFT_199705 [Capitella teleta]|eukprot:ELT91047.1 hypothetical protein CAPTEDRAFT_199705 [Capitella teleta]
MQMMTDEESQLLWSFWCGFLMQLASLCMTFSIGINLNVILFIDANCSGRFGVESFGLGLSCNRQVFGQVILKTFIIVFFFWCQQSEKNHPRITRKGEYPRKQSRFPGILEPILNIRKYTIISLSSYHLIIILSLVAVSSAVQDINREVYSRKWNLVIHGIQGAPKEEEATTEDKVRQMGAECLKIASAQDKSQHPFAACHRLSAAKDAGIIVKFANLSSKNQWLANAKNQRNTRNNISISPDTPRCLKGLRSELLGYKKNLPVEQKKAAKTQYSQAWPFITLNLGNGRNFKPKFCVEDLVNRYYEHSAANIDYNYNHIKL